MTLDSKLSKAVYQGNGSTTVFPFAFKVWDSNHIAVTVTDAAGVSTDVTSNSTVTLTSSGGSVTYPKSGSPLPGSAKLAITRNMPFVQGINLVSASRFDPQVLEDGLDQATAERQQILEQMARAVILPPTSNESPEDVVASIYASRDAAAASASAASNKADAAEVSAQAAANSASTAAQTVETAAAEAVSAATAQANAAHDSALAAAQSAAEAEAAVPDNLVARVTAVEDKNTQQDTRLDAVETKNTQQDTRLDAVNTSLAGKLNADMSNRPAGSQYLVSTWTNGTSWYRKYSDGFIEQGGYLGVIGTTNITVTFPIPFAGASYVLNVYAFDLDTTSGHPRTAWRNTYGFNFGKTSSAVDTNWYAAGY
ncbi:hypothetical protein [uncultured Desulfovibrio sp.]|uniref:gp53-like domain-containing protein n=1 Tax=uncultured Desulfovibrio sp. TaxID=167968 RepID=UPI0026290D2F|nr:hypothetical protein [uncultured Desulfovibrio sp.]